MNGGRPSSGAVVDGVDFDHWDVILCKPDAVARGLTARILETVAAAGCTVTDRMDVIAHYRRRGRAAIGREAEDGPTTA